MALRLSLRDHRLSRRFLRVFLPAYLLPGRRELPHHSGNLNLPVSPDDFLPFVHGVDELASVGYDFPLFDLVLGVD